MLATLALEKSHRGSELKRLSDAGFLVSVYMDDILISADTKDVLEEASEAIVGAADLSGLPLPKDKWAIAVPGVDTFDCHIESSDMTILHDRMEKFVDQRDLATEPGKQAIEKYINAVSNTELARFLGMV